MFKNKVVIVTGGTKGIGKCLVKKFLEQGAKVITNYAHNELDAENMKESLKEYGDRFSIYKASVTNPLDVQKMVEDIIQKYRKIDILVNNAGVEVSKLLMQITTEEWSRVIDTNLTGTFICSKTVLPKMISKKYGRIINISSVAGNNGNVGQAAYSASKAGINALTKVLAKESARFGITVNAVAPGFIKTDMAVGFESEYKDRIPLKRFGDISEVANLVLYLASDDTAYITGSISVIDGGLTL